MYLGNVLFSIVDNICILGVIYLTLLILYVSWDALFRIIDNICNGRCFIPYVSGSEVL